MPFPDPDEMSEMEFMEYELNRDSDGLYDAINKWKPYDEDERPPKEIPIEEKFFDYVDEISEEIYSINSRIEELNNKLYTLKRLQIEFKQKIGCELTESENEIANPPTSEEIPF